MSVLATQRVDIVENKVLSNSLTGSNPLKSQRYTRAAKFLFQRSINHNSIESVGGLKMEARTLGIVHSNDGTSFSS